MKIKILSKIIEYGLYLLVFLLPIQTRWIIKAGQINGGYWEYGSISLYGTDILSLIILVLFIVRRFYLPECQMSNVKCQNKFQIPNPNLPAQAGQMLNLKFQTPIYWWFVFGLVLASVVSIFFASNKLLALFKFGWLMLGVGLFWLIIRSNYSKLKLILGLLAGIFLQAVLGIWQFLSQSSFSSKWLGMAYHEAANLGTSVVETIAANGTGERWLRAYGGLDHPNVLGGALTAGILLVIWVLLKEWEGKEFFPPRGISRGETIFNKFLNLKIFKLFTFYFLLFTYFTALIFTFSRSAWLAIVVALTVLLIDAVIKRNLIMQKKVLEIILASGFLVFILFNQYSNLFLTRLTAGERLEIKSTSERLESYKNFLQLFKKNWFWGVGVGNYTLYNANLHNADQCGLMRTDAEIRMYAYDANCKIIPSWYYQPVHNVFLLVWAETGIAGLIFYLGLIVYLFIFCFRFLINNKMSNVECQMSNEKYQRQYTMNNIFNIAIILSLIILMLFDHWLWSLHFGVLFFWLVVGLMIRENGKETIVVL